MHVGIFQACWYCMVITCAILLKTFPGFWGRLGNEATGFFIDVAYNTVCKKEGHAQLCRLVLSYTDFCCLLCSSPSCGLCFYTSMTLECSWIIIAILKSIWDSCSPNHSIWKLITDEVIAALYRSHLICKDYNACGISVHVSDYKQLICTSLVPREIESLESCGWHQVDMRLGLYSSWCTKWLA